QALGLREVRRPRVREHVRAVTHLGLLAATGGQYHRQNTRAQYRRCLLHVPTRSQIRKVTSIFHPAGSGFKVSASSSSPGVSAHPSLIPSSIDFSSGSRTSV